MSLETKLVVMYKKIKEQMDDKNRLLGEQAFAEICYDKQLELCKLNAVITKNTMNYFELARNASSDYIYLGLKAFDIAYRLQDHRAELCLVAKIKPHLTEDMLCTNSLSKAELDRRYGPLNYRSIYACALAALLGYGERQVISKGIELLKFAAAKKDDAALYLLGQIYSWQTTDYCDYVKAFDLLKQVTRARRAAAVYSLGLIKSYADDCESLIHWREAVGLGNKKAQNNLAIAIEEAAKTAGIDLSPENKCLVKKYYTLAANQDDRDAQFNLGVFIYYYEDNAEATVRYWLGKAHHLGHPEAEKTLIELFGVSKKNNLCVSPASVLAPSRSLIVESTRIDNVQKASLQG